MESREKSRGKSISRFRNRISLVRRLLVETYRIPIIDLETMDLLPIHFLVDPGVNFQWPRNEELSDEQIRSYANMQQNRMDILHQYLDLSNEYSPYNHFRSMEHEYSRSIIDHSDSGNMDASIEKKSSRSSLNSLSKTIRRKLLHPFSSTKRFSLKNQHAPVINGNIFQRQDSSLSQSSSGILTIILVNFQPKRPKISDHMIQNYIDTCINEHHSKQMRRNQRNSSNDTRSSISHDNPTCILSEDKPMTIEMRSIQETSNHLTSVKALRLIESKVCLFLFQDDDRSIVHGNRTSHRSSFRSELRSSSPTNVDDLNN